MFSLIISIFTSAVAVVMCVQSQTNIGWTLVTAIAVFVATMVAISLGLRKKIQVVNEDLQGIMLGGQKRISQKVQAFQNKPGGDPRHMQRVIEKEQAECVEKALEFTANLEPFCKWNMLMPKQIATMRLQFNYQLKRYDAVDELMPKVLMMDPMTVAMCMARHYKNDDMAAMEKLFEKKIKRFKGAKGTLLYGLMSWAYVKKGEVNKAREVLFQGKEATGNETLRFNWEQLSNDRAKKFSNAGLGDEWYGLYLEAPKPPKQQRVRANATGRPF